MDLFILNSRIELTRSRVACHFLIDPGNKECILNSGLQDRCAREEVIGKALVNQEETDLITNTLHIIAELGFSATKGIL